MAEIQQYPDRQEGRAHRTTLLEPPFRLTPANDNRGPGWRLTGWILLMLLGAVVVASWGAL